MEEPASPLNLDTEVSFIGKDDGLEKRVSLFIEGKHGRIGIIRSDKIASSNDRQQYVDSLARIVCRSILANEDKAQDR